MLLPGDALSASLPIVDWTIEAHWSKDDLPKLTRATFIGIVIAISGNVLISLALNLQKLAHKRVEAGISAKRKQCGEVTSENGQHRRSNGPSLDERDEEHMPTPTPPDSNERAESEPLIPFPYSPSPADYGSTSVVNPGDDSHSRPAFSSRLIGALFRRNRPRQPALPVPYEAIIPVDVMSEEAALCQQGSKHTYIRHDMAEEGHETAYLKSKLWWFGFFLMNVGETGNFISYAWAPASIVAPLGTFALMANCFFAPLLLGERFRKRDLIGILIAIIGAVTVVLASNASNTRLDPDALLHAISQTPFIIYSCGFTVLSTKAISTLLTSEWIAMFSNWITYPVLAVLIITGVGQIRYLNRALMRFDGKVVIPVQFVLFTLSAIIGSAILYGDFQRAKFHQIVTFLYGCAATFVGVFIIAWAPNSEDVSDDTGNVHNPHTDNSSQNDPPHLGLGTLGRRSRATLVMPSGARDTPMIRNQRSNVSLLGLSPAQHLLLVHTPPREVPIHSQTPPSNDAGRQRTMSWLRDDTASASPGATRESSITDRLGRAGHRNRGGSLDIDHGI
ncbi:hypothetical protein H0H92_004833 [Tricholoma furcatifolium]|nr:hypothetical protein H0H92_004833 [Tricholoma furcatifolium]